MDSSVKFKIGDRIKDALTGLTSEVARIDSIKGHYICKASNAGPGSHAGSGMHFIIPFRSAIEVTASQMNTSAKFKIGDLVRKNDCGSLYRIEAISFAEHDYYLESLTNPVTYPIPVSFSQLETRVTLVKAGSQSSFSMPSEIAGLNRDSGTSCTCSGRQLLFMGCPKLGKFGTGLCNTNERGELVR